MFTINIIITNLIYLFLQMAEGNQNKTRKNLNQNQIQIPNIPTLVAFKNLMPMRVVLEEFHLVV